MSRNRLSEIQGGNNVDLERNEGFVAGEQYEMQEWSTEQQPQQRYQEQILTLDQFLDEVQSFL